MLAAVAARLDDEDGDVRSAAVNGLRERIELPNVVLTVLAARLDDKVWDVRRAAIDILGRQASLPDEVLTAVAARLNDIDRHVRRAAVDVLLHRHEKFCLTILKGTLIVSLYKTLFEQSFEEQLSWYMEKDDFYINMPDGIAKLSIDIQQNEVKEWINEARPADCPSISWGELVP